MDTVPGSPLDEVAVSPPPGPFFTAGRHLWGWPVVPVYSVLDAARAGHFVWVEPGVELMIGGNHRLDWVTTFPAREVYHLPGAGTGIPWSKGPIVIGHGVRLQRGSRVLSGVTIGDGARVAPCSVVIRNVRPYSVVAGNPAREVGLRFNAEVVARLAQTAWWDWYDDMTLWRLDRLTGGQAHVLVPQLGRTGPKARPAALRRSAAHFLRGLAHRLDIADPPAKAGAAPEVEPDTGGASGVATAAAVLDDPAAALPASPEHIPMGRGSYGFPTVHGPIDRVTIGNFCSIASESLLLADGHEPLADRVRGTCQSVSSPAGPLRLGNDVWVGRGACILPGVTIGDGAAIAAYAVVSDDVRPYAVMAGNPAREVKRRFDDATVAALLRIRWWDWEESVVRERADELCSEDVAGFVARYGPDIHDEGSRTTP